MGRKAITFFSALFLLLTTFGISSAYMDPETGRFITQDPYLGEVSRAPSLHRYNYANLNPAFYIDRDGHDYVEVQENKAYWVVQENIPGPFDFDTRRVHIGNTTEDDPNNVYLTSEFGDGKVDLERLQDGADSYWGRYDVEEEKSVFNPSDISSLDPSLQDQLIQHYIHNRMDPHNKGGIYADRDLFRSTTTRNLDRAQTAGDIAGMAPGVGIFVDTANTVVYGLRGKWGDFGYSAAAIIPGLGQGATTAKYGKKGVTLLDEGVETVSKNGPDWKVAAHGNMPTPRPPGYQSHHGVNSVWAEANIEGYVAKDAPAILMKNNPYHNATRGLFNRVRGEIARNQGVSSRNINWNNVSPGTAWRLAEEQLEAARVPQAVREDYFREFNKYMGTLR